MFGKFTGLSDEQWAVFSKFLPEEPERKRPGMPHASFRFVANSILFILITGARWCDLPDNAEIFAPRSTAHRWLKRWQEDGTLEKIKRDIAVAVDIDKIIDWSRASIDGSFSPWEGRRSRR